MRGGAQGHLMRCSDGQFYVVKFRNNPQHLRVLANELLATRLAELANLPVPATEVVEVGDWLIRHTPELNIQLASSTIPCEPGLQFGSRYVVSPLEGQVFDYLPMEMLERVRNLPTFAGMLALDKWTGNANGRQAAFWRKMRERKYTVSFIDQGYCFNAGEWTFPDYPLRGVYARNEVYAAVKGWHSFEPWLSQIEHMKEDGVWAAAGEIPPEWYGGDWDVLEKLVLQLLERRTRVRELITAFRLSPRRPFPEWKEDA
jgi:HipA-like protein